MNIKRYAVLDVAGNLLIRGAELELVFAFIRGFMASFYNEALDLRIVEDPAYSTTSEVSEDLSTTNNDSDVPLIVTEEKSTKKKSNSSDEEE